MNRYQTMEWGAKLIEALANLPENADVHGFSIILNTNTKPFHKELAIHLSGKVDMPAVIGNKYSGWNEMRVYLKPDVYVWWAQSTTEDIEDDDGTSDA